MLHTLVKVIMSNATDEELRTLWNIFNTLTVVNYDEMDYVFTREEWNEHFINEINSIESNAELLEVLEWHAFNWPKPDTKYIIDNYRGIRCAVNIDEFVDEEKLFEFIANLEPSHNNDGELMRVIGGVLCRLTGLLLV